MDMEIINGVRITLLPDNGGGIILSYYAQDCPSPEKMARIQAILHDKSKKQCRLFLGYSLQQCSRATQTNATNLLFHLTRPTHIDSSVASSTS